RLGAQGRGRGAHPARRAAVDPIALVAGLLAGGCGLLRRPRATPVGELRDLLTGPGYSDNYRVTAILAVVAIPVLAVGIDAIGGRAAAVWPVLRSLLGVVVAMLLTAAVLTMNLLSPATAVSQQ